MRVGMPASLLAALLAGCTLTEVGIPEGEDVAVVEAILNAGQPTQRLLLHRSLENGSARPLLADSILLRAPGGRVLRYTLDAENTRPAGSNCVTEADEATTGGVSCYALPFTPIPGSSYDLDVFFDGNRRIRGRTQVPGVFQLSGPAGVRAGRCVLPPGTQLELAWTRSPGAWSYLADLEIRGLRNFSGLEGTASAPDPLNLFGLAISDSDTTLSVPADFGLFQSGEIDNRLLRALQNGLPGGVTARVTVAAADRNYVNGVRGGIFNPSGLVRLSSVVGDGTGVFGSVLPRTLLIQVHRGSTGAPCVGS